MLRFPIFPAVFVMGGLSFGQATCETAVELDPCGGTTTGPMPVGTDFPTTCATFFTAWARITPAASGPLTVSIAAGLGRLSVFTGDCGSLTEIACESAEVTLDVTEGTTYYFQGEGFFGLSQVELATSVIDVNCAVQDGSSCLQALSLDPCGGESTPFATAPDTVTADSSCQLTNAGRWFEITPETSGMLTLTIAGNFTNNAGGNPVPDIAVFQGECDALVEVDCLDAALGSTGLTIPVTAGTRYSILLTRGGPLVTIQSVGTLITSALRCGGCSPTVYCTSNGDIAIGGTQSVGTNDTEITVSNVDATFGLFFMGMTQTTSPGAACTLAGGMQCIAGPIMRLGPATFAAGGMNTRALDFTDPGGGASAVMAGQSWNFQYWYRGAGMANTCNYSDAINACFTN